MPDRLESAAHGYGYVLGAGCRLIAGDKVRVSHRPACRIACAVSVGLIFRQGLQGRGIRGLFGSAW